MDIKPALRDFLSDKGWDWRENGDGQNIDVKTCPFCDRSRWKFAIHAETTQFRCWSASCGEKGNLYTLKKALAEDPDPDIQSAARMVATGKYSKSTKEGGDTGRRIPMEDVERWHKNLLKSRRGKEYCKSRGFGLESIQFFKLGMKKMRGQYWLSIPHLQGGQCLNIKYRLIGEPDPDDPDAQKWQKAGGMSSIMFNADCIPEHDTIYVAEAELDAISIWEAGCKNVVALTCGADNFLPLWYDKLQHVEKVILVLDNDLAGQKGARDIGRRLGFDKCTNIELSETDANAVLVADGPEALAAEMLRDKEFAVEGVFSVDQILTEMIQRDDEEEKVGILTPWDAVNQLIYPGFMPGDLVMITAKAKVGKTTMALGICDWMDKQGIPTLTCCLEMSMNKLVEKIIMMRRRKPMELISGHDALMVRHEMRKKGTHMYFVAPTWGTASIKLQEIFDKIREGVRRYGCKLVVFDHLHFLCRGNTGRENTEQMISNATKGFKLLAQELDIPIFLIAQPKIKRQGLITSEDMKGSQSIVSDCDHAITLNREQVPRTYGTNDPEGEMETMSSTVLFTLDVSRFGGTGTVKLHYEGRLATFVNFGESIR